MARRVLGLVSASAGLRDCDERWVGGTRVIVCYNHEDDTMEPTGDEFKGEFAEKVARIFTDAEALLARRAVGAGLEARFDSRGATFTVTAPRGAMLVVGEEGIGSDAQAAALVDELVVAASAEQPRKARRTSKRCTSK